MDLPALPEAAALPCLHGAAAAPPDILLCPAEAAAAWPCERWCHAEVVTVLMVGDALAVADGKAEVQDVDNADIWGTIGASRKGLGEPC